MLKALNRIELATRWSLPNFVAEFNLRSFFFLWSGGFIGSVDGTGFNLSDSAFFFLLSFFFWERESGVMVWSSIYLRMRTHLGSPLSDPSHIRSIISEIIKAMAPLYSIVLYTVVRFQTFSWHRWNDSIKRFVQGIYRGCVTFVRICSSSTNYLVNTDIDFNLQQMFTRNNYQVTSKYCYRYKRYVNASDRVNYIRIRMYSYMYPPRVTQI